MKKTVSEKFIRSLQSLVVVMALGVACTPPPQGDDLFEEKPPTETGPNELPIINGTCALTLTQDATFSCAPTAFDPDSLQPLLWSFGPGHTCGDWMSIHPNEGSIEALPGDDAVGTCNLVLKVTDGQSGVATVVQELSIANQAPTMSLSNPSDILQNAGETVLRTDAQVQANEEGFGSYSVNPLSTPACADNGVLSIDSQNGEILFDPDGVFSGTCHINVQFDDENGEANSIVAAEISLDVIAVIPPVVDISFCASSLDQDGVYSCVADVTDPDSGSHTWSLGPNNTCLWASVGTSTGAITGSPNDDQVGPCNLTVIANDGSSDSNEASQTITINNLQPTLTIADADDLPEDSAATVIRSDAQVQANEESFGAYSLIDGTSPQCSDNGSVMIHATNGQVTFAPTTDYTGLCHINVEFDDGNAEINSKVTSEFSISVLPQNDPPVISGSCGAIVGQDTFYNCTPSLSDPDGSTPTWSLAAGNTCMWIAINSGTGEVSGFADDDAVGECNLAMKANDGSDDSNTLNFTLDVTNMAPTLSIADAANISRDSPPTEIRGDADIAASEEGFGVYTLTPTSSPRCSDNGSVTINASTGAVVYEPAPAYTGTCNIEVTFDDQNGLVNSTVSDEFSIEVEEIEPLVLGLANDSTPTQNKSWTWSCNTTCEFRFAINTSASHSFSSEPFSATTASDQNSGTDTFYIHVQARDTNTLLTSQVVSVSAVIDNTAPTAPSSLSLDGDMTETTTDTLHWLSSSDETELSHYQMKVGTTSGGNELVDWTDIGNVLSGNLSATVVVGQTYFSSVRAVDTAGNVSAPVTSGGWVLPGPPNAITNLVISSAKTTEITIGWSAPFDNGRAISDYFVEYKETSSGTWLSFADGVSTDTIATVTSLTPETSYDFRVAAYNGASSPISNVATGETLVDDPFFEPGSFKAMNLGGATTSAVVAMEDNTVITLNGSALATLNAGETHGFTSSQDDVIEGDKPIFVAGRKGSGGDNFKGNMVWNTPDWAGKDFLFTGSRNPPHLVTVYAFQDATITVKDGPTTIDTQVVTEGSNHTFSINANGGFSINSSGSIVAHMHSSGGGTVIDPKPLLPASTDIIGVPSRDVRLTTLQSGNSFTGYHSDNTTSSGTLTAGSETTVGGKGNVSYYQAQALRVIASTPAVGNSNADFDGYCSAPFVPVGMMKKRYALNVSAQWVAFASTEPGTIDMIDPSGGTTQLTLTKTGSDPNTPYKAYTTIKAAGFRFESTTRFAAWYEPSTDTFGADADETIMFGAD